MGPAPNEDDQRVPGLFLRIGGAVLAIGTYLLLRDSLAPAPLVAARFGLGIVLFALLVDVGRALAGASAPMVGDLAPHRQRAEPLVDESYRRVHRGVRQFIDEGHLSPEYRAVLTEALSSRGVPDIDVTEALDRAEATARAPPPTYRPVALGLASGAVVVLGVTFAIGALLESIDVPLAAPVLILLGLGTSTLQVRTVSIGERWGTLAVGLLGALLVFLGASGLQEMYGGGWAFLQFVALGMAAVSAGLAWLYRFERPSWPKVREQLQNELHSLRRAFVATLLAGVVLFPFQPLLEALFVALDWRFEVPYRMAVIGYGTIAAFLAMELAGAWYALGRGERRAAQLRRDRIEANEAMLQMLAAKGAAPGLTGGRPT